MASSGAAVGARRKIGGDAAGAQSRLKVSKYLCALMASRSTSSMSVRCVDTNSSYEWQTGSVDSETSCIELLRAER